MEQLLTPDRLRQVGDVKLTVDSFDGELRTYQKLGAAYLCQRTGVILADPCGTGKCFARNTPVLMADGTVKMVQDVNDGEYVMGWDSTPRRVYGVRRGLAPLYKVTPTKGEPFVVNGDHVLVLRRRQYNGQALNRKGVFRDFTMTVDEYMAKPDIPHWRRNLMMFRVPVEFSEQVVPLDPYFLGLWLGDGTSREVSITTADREIVSYLDRLALRYGVRLVMREGRCPTYALSAYVGRSNPMLTMLQELGVLNNKHVPQRYLSNSRQVRLEVLAGLLDSDGHYRDGGYEITTKHDKLRDGILYLARSLGLAAYAKEKEGRCKRADGTFFSGTYWRVSISGDCTVIPVKLDRKRAQARKQVKDVLNFGFTVESVGTGEFFGFGVEGDHKFLLGDFTVTHNTWTALAALAVLFERMRARNALVVTLGTSVDQWADELDTHTEWSYQMYRGPHRKGYLGSSRPDIRLTTYDTMRLDVQLLMDAGHDVVIYDEANVIQNCWPPPKGPSQVHTAAEFLSSSARWVWSLTATPVETSLFNMYGIYRGMGRCIYPTLDAFLAAHIEMEYVDVPVVRRVRGKKQFQQRVMVPKIKRNINIDLFKDRIADFYLRRELEELGIEMPDVVSIDVSLDMAPAQRRVYDEITAGILAQGPAVFRTVAGGQKLNYQARCCDGLASLPNAESDISVKLDECVRRVRDDLLPEQVVVFSRYIKPLEELEQRFAAEGIATGRIDGEVGADACRRAKHGFETGDIKVLLLSEKGERALNLPQARYLIMVQQLWNPSRTLQLIGRLRRMTSKWKGIIVFNLLCRDTFEERMIGVVRERSELFTDVFGSEDLLKAMPEDEAFSLVTGSGRRRT